MKHRWIFAISTVVLLSTFLLPIWLGSGDQATTKGRKKPIPELSSDTMTAKKAKELSGLGSFGVWGTPTVIAGDDVNIPFVGKTLKGEKVLCINVTGGSLGLGSENEGGGNEGRPCEYTILLDHESGQILMITAVIEKGGTGEHSPKASIASAERQMRKNGEIYTGFPKENALVNFHDALSNIHTSGFGGNPLEASEIEAVYVMQSHLNKEPRAIWAITLRGISPFPVFGGNEDSVPISQRNHLRNIVDAKTGKVLRSTTIPQP